MKGAGRPVTVANRHPGVTLDRRGLAAAIRLLDAHGAAFRGGCPGGELSLAVLTDADLALVHGRFLGDPAPTDVITFEGGAGLAGEICVSADAAARVGGRSNPGFSRELSLYIVHGWLHLAGFGDLDPPAKRAMRRAEARAMQILLRNAAVPRFKLA